MRIVVLDRDTVTNGDLDFSALEALGEVTYFDVISHENIAEACANADAVIINKAEMTRDVLEKLPELKYIGLFATGYNNVDTAAAREFGIDVVNAPGYSTASVAQLVFAFILSFATSIGDYNASVHRGDWVGSATFSYFPFRLTELAGKTLGIAGFGAIGGKVAEIGSALGMNVIVYTRTPKKNCPYRFVSKEELFAESDFLSLNCPLNEGTKNLVNRETLALMKSDAFIVNTARGGVVDSQALADALNSGKIAGAGIDVLIKEPMRADDPLRTAKNCMITPHIAWASKEARDRLIAMVAESLRLWKEGKPRFVVNP
ncbi:MAG: D-2-hydroxyacid dehydrogenase [Clostridia bacterium]|nr:D-2-hydroxyacid dehydrogenase [Clostridia bacterium]